MDMGRRNILVLGHGRKHQKILSLSDNDNIFYVDKDPNVEPDIVMNIHEFSTESFMSKQFNKIYTANCSTMVIAFNETLRTNVIESIYHFLKDDGEFVTTCPARFPNFIGEMKKYGFTFLRYEDVYFELSNRLPRKYLCFVKNI